MIDSDQCCFTDNLNLGRKIFCGGSVMSSIIFIDVFKDKETGAIPSLAELLTRNLLKRKFYTKPGLIVIEDDFLYVYSSKVDFKFNAATAEIKFSNIKHEIDDEKFFIDKCCGDLNYFLDNIVLNASVVVQMIFLMFNAFFVDGIDGFSKGVRDITAGKYDYSLDDDGVEYGFWYKDRFGDWNPSSFNEFAEYICSYLINPNKFTDCTDGELMSESGYHFGYDVLVYALDKRFLHIR